MRARRLAKLPPWSWVRASSPCRCGPRVICRAGFFCCSRSSSLFPDPGLPRLRHGALEEARRRCDEAARCQRRRQGDCSLFEGRGKVSVAHHKGSHACAHRWTQRTCSPSSARCRACPSLRLCLCFWIWLPLCDPHPRRLCQMLTKKDHGAAAVQLPFLDWLCDWLRPGLEVCIALSCFSLLFFFFFFVFGRCCFGACTQNAITRVLTFCWVGSLVRLVCALPFPFPLPLIPRLRVCTCNSCALPASKDTSHKALWGSAR
jgi:hypothetical protein